VPPPNDDDAIVTSGRQDERIAEVANRALAQLADSATLPDRIPGPPLTDRAILKRSRKMTNGTSPALQDDATLTAPRKNAMPETLDTLGTKLDTLGEKLDALGVSVDQRFAQVDQRFAQVDQRFDELKAELGTRIEAVDAKVDLVLEGFDNLLKKDAANAVAHARMDARLDNHELRLTALEGDRQE
jgi:hypothetical protein